MRHRANQQAHRAELLQSLHICGRQLGHPCGGKEVDRIPDGVGYRPPSACEEGHDKSPGKPPFYSRNVGVNGGRQVKSVTVFPEMQVLDMTVGVLDGFGSLRQGHQVDIFVAGVGENIKKPADSSDDADEKTEG